MVAASHRTKTKNLIMGILQRSPTTWFTAKALADRIGVRGNAVARILALLFENNLVERRPSAGEDLDNRSGRASEWRLRSPE